MTEQRSLSSQKRKRQSCTSNHPMVGIFTRSKSQIYIHRNRSGRARFDPRTLGPSFALPHSEKRRRRVLTQGSSDVNDLSCLSIKDLRSRRVFSNGFGLGVENEEGKESEKGIGISESGFSCNTFFNRDVIDANVSKYNDKIEKLDFGLSSKDLNLKDADPSSFPEELKMHDEHDFSNPLGGLGEEHVQSTPPDIKVLIGTKEVQENGEQKVGFLMEKQSNESEHNQRNSNNSAIKSALRPCYRVKLFKAPGSFSHRRLLPYLMDISEDKCCVRKMGQHQKFEKGPEEYPHSSSHGQGILINNSTSESCPAESNDVDHVKKSKSTSIECMKGVQNESCMGVDFSHTSISMVEEWSKPIVNWEIEKFEIKTSSQEPNLVRNNSIIAISNETKSMDSGETAKIDVDYCDPQNMNNFFNLTEEVSLLKCNSSKDNEGGQCFEDTKQLKAEGVYESHVGDSSQDNNLNPSNADSPNREQNFNLISAEQRDDESGDFLGHINNSNKEHVLMRPPDDDIFGKAVVAESGGNGVKRMQNVGNLLGKPLSGGAYRNNNAVDDKTIASSSTRKLVLNQCSRLKFFKTPGSMGYRRMLPFLMEIMKDNSSASRKDPLLKFEKSYEADPLSPSLVSDCQEMPIENSNGNECHHERQTGDHSALPIAVKLASSNDQEPNTASYKYGNESPKPLHLQLEKDVHFERYISDSVRKLEGPETMDKIGGSNLPGMSLCSLCSSGSFLRKDAPRSSSLNVDKDWNKSIIEVNNDANQIEAENLLQNSSHYSKTSCFSIPAAVSKMGILKRTPRGCRGLCTCLNCSSFRLHAEKAFEFSRNQMQDAEEVVLDLIKELSYVRNMLEKSAFSDDGHALVCTSQVKEACRRISKAEELAQNRLGGMNFDLNIHCRVTCAQRPRVTFANYVEEKFITESDLESQSKYRLMSTGKGKKLC